MVRQCRESKAIQKLIEAGELPTPKAINNILQDKPKPAPDIKCPASIEIVHAPDFQPQKFGVKDFITYFRNRYTYYKHLLIL